MISEIAQAKIAKFVKKILPSISIIQNDGFSLAEIESKVKLILMANYDENQPEKFKDGLEFIAWIFNFILENEYKLPAKRAEDLTVEFLAAINQELKKPAPTEASSEVKILPFTIRK